MCLSPSNIQQLHRAHKTHSMALVEEIDPNPSRMLNLIYFIAVRPTMRRHEGAGKLYFYMHIRPACILNIHIL